VLSQVRYASFQRGAEAGWGVVRGSVLHRLDGHGGLPVGLKDLLARLADGFEPDLAGAATLPLDGLTLLPPIPDPAKILCVANNFHEEGKPAPDYPLVFTRYPDSLVGHGTPIRMPAVSDSFDYEGEVALVIGKAGHRIPHDRALDHIAGYACFNDGSVRDWQKHSSQFTPGKTFFQSGSFGPWMVVRRAMPDLSAATLTTRVNGVVKQQIALSRMIFDPAWLIAYVSTFTPLAPGDIIATGTPGGFGATRRPPEFLRPGDRVEVKVTALGTLANSVVEDHDPRREFFRKE